MSKPNPHDWLNEHGDYLYRFALARLRDPHQAEDAVQETLLAAIKSTSFEGESSARTWLTGILKHKIIDIMRKGARETVVSDIVQDEAEIDDFFDATGHFVDTPKDWASPDNALQQDQFLTIMQSCLDKLPEKLRTLFVLREIEEADNAEICKDLEISPTNAWVMLHRARLGLRKCIEINWLGVA